MPNGTCRTNREEVVAVSAVAPQTASNHSWCIRILYQSLWKLVLWMIIWTFLEILVGVETVNLVAGKKIQNLRFFAVASVRVDLNWVEAAGCLKGRPKHVERHYGFRRSHP